MPCTVLDILNISMCLPHGRPCLKYTWDIAVNKTTKILLDSGGKVTDNK